MNWKKKSYIKIMSIIKVKKVVAQITRMRNLTQKN